jgi:hypothetical protein
MPDYSLVPGITDTVDRRGSNYNAGLGGETPSPFLAGVQGLIGGLKAGADISSEIQTTLRENDPQKLADEELRRQLSNVELSKAIETATINNSTLNDKNLADIGYKKAATTNEYATAAHLGAETNVINATGIESANARSAYERAEADALPLKTGTDLLSAQTHALHEVGKNSPGSVTVPPSANFDVPLPPGQAQPQALSPTQQLQQQILENTKRLNDISYHNKALDANNTVSTQVQSAAVDTQKKITDAAHGSVAAQNYSDLVTAANDHAIGEPNFDAALPPLMRLSTQAKQAATPESQKLYSRYITDGLDKLGGADAVLQHIDEQVGTKDPDRAKQLKSAVFGAIANSGDLAKLPGQQKDILTAGLGVEHISDPEDTYDKMGLLISGKSSQINDSTFKNVMRDNDYIIAARKASANGTQPFTITADRIPTSGTGPDSVSGQDANQKVMVFSNADGSISIPAKAPADDKDHAVLNMLDEVQKRQGAVATLAQNTNKAITGIQQNVSDVKQVNPVQVQTQTAAAQGADVVVPPGTSGDQSQMIGGQQSSANASSTTAAPNMPASTPNQSLMKPGVPQEVQPGVTQTLAQDGKTIRIENENLGLTSANGTALSTNPESLKDQSFRDWMQKGLDETKASAAAQKDVKNYQTEVKDLATKQAQTSNMATADMENVDRIRGVIDLAEKTGHTDLLGLTGDYEKFKEKAKQYADAGDPVAADIVGRIADAKYNALKNVLANAKSGTMYRGWSQEKAAMDAYLNSENSVDSLKNNIDNIEALAHKHQNVADLTNVLIQNHLPASKIQEIVNKYANSDVSNPLKYDASLPSGGSQYVANTGVFKTPKQFLGYPGSTDSNFIPPTSTPSGPASTSKMSGTSGSWTDDNTGGAGTEANPPLTSTSTDNSAQTALDETRKQLRDYIGGKTDRPVDFGDPASTAKALQERAAKDPEFRKLVDQVKKDGGDPSVIDHAFASLPGMLNLGNNVGSQIANFEDFLGFHDTAEKQRAGIVGENEQLHDYGNQHPVKALLGDVLAFSLVTHSLTGATEATTEALANQFPKVKSALEFLKGTNAAGEQIGGALPATIRTASEFGKNVATDAVANATIGEGDTKDKLEKGAIWSAGIRAAFGTLKGGGKLIAGLIPGEPVTEMAKIFAHAGADPDNLAEAVQKSQQTGQHFSGYLNGTNRNIFEQILATPSGQTAIDKAATVINAGNKAATAAADTAAGLDKTKSVEATRDAFNADIGSQVDSAATTAATDATAQSKTALNDTLQKITNDRIQTAQEGIDKIRETVGADPAQMKTGKTPTTIEGHLAVGEKVKAAIARNLSPLYQEVEQNYTKFAGLEGKNLIRQLKNQYGDNAAKAVAATDQGLTGMTSAGATAGKTAPNQSSFKYLTELHNTITGKLSQDGSASQAQTKEMASKVVDTINSNMEKRNPSGGSTQFTDFLNQYGRLSELGKTVENQQGILLDIRNSVLASRGEGKIINKGTIDSLYENFGKKSADSIRESLEAHDDAITQLSKANAKDVDAIQLSADLKKALPVTGPSVNIGEKLLTGEPETIDAVTKALTPSNKQLVGESALRAVRDRLESNRAGLENSVIDPKTKAYQLLGMDDLQYANLKKMLSPSQMDLVEKTLDSRVVQSNAADLMKTSANTKLGGEMYRFKNTVVRRLFETRAKIVLDLATDHAFNTLSRAQQQMITKNMLANPAEANDFMRSVAEKLQVTPTSYGSEVTVKAAPRVFDSAEFQLGEKGVKRLLIRYGAEGSEKNKARVETINRELNTPLNKAASDKRAAAKKAILNQDE